MMDPHVHDSSKFGYKLHNIAPIVGTISAPHLVIMENIDPIKLEKVIYNEMHYNYF